MFHVITAPWTLKGNQIIQGLALIRAVLFVVKNNGPLFQTLAITQISG